MRIKDKEALATRIRDSHEFSTEEKSQLLGLLNDEKTFGLVWEDKPEEALELLRSKLPYLREDTNRQIVSANPDAPNHILVEGDNLHALTALSFAFEGKIDVIYIDPPYNTGAKNWKYNNDYVDNEDSYRHSKFISFMHHRLNLAKRFLSERGIIICAIDDYEEHNVRHLMDEVFREENRLGTVTVVHNPRGRNDDTFIATMHEYLLFYAKDASIAEVGYFPMSEKDISAYNKNDGISAFSETSFIRTGNNSLRTERPGLWYEIYYNIENNSLSLIRQTEKDILLLPINAKGEERCWRWGPDTFERLKDTELFVKQVKGEYKIFKKRRITNIEGRKPRTVWQDSKYDASSNGIMLLQNIFNGTCPFPYPKSLYAVFDCLYITLPQNGIAMDFFAGSGTTLHATMQLNKEDGGHRQCILVTNNENNICEEVTYERNKRVINGYTTPKGEKIEGLTANNLRYYKVDFVERKQSNENRRKLMEASTDILMMKENLYTEHSTFAGLKLPKQAVRYFAEGDKQMLVIYNPIVIPHIAKAIAKAESPTRPIQVYVMSEGQYPYTDDFAEVLDRVELHAMPASLYQAYRHVLPKIAESAEIEGQPEVSEQELAAATDDIFKAEDYD